jgi:hypothetical protein
VLAAVVDWFSQILSHRVSITMEADFCIEALEEAPGTSLYCSTSFLAARNSTAVSRRFAIASAE